MEPEPPTANSSICQLLDGWKTGQSWKTDRKAALDGRRAERITATAASFYRQMQIVEIPPFMEAEPPKYKESGHYLSTLVLALAL